MIKLRAIFLMILFIFISSCVSLDEFFLGIDYSKTRIEIKYDATCDIENSNIATADAIAVIALNNEDLTSRNNVPAVVNALKRKGFSNVLANKITNNTKFVFYINLSNKTESYNYNYNNYGYKGTGNYSTTCYGGYCNTKEEKVFGITGTSVGTGYTTYTSLYVRVVKIIHVTSEKKYQTMRVADIFGGSYNKIYSPDYLYNLLIKETINKIDFLKSREKYNYIVDLKQKKINKTTNLK